MESDFEKFTGFQWDEGNKNKNLIKHQVENWECEQVFFNEPLPARVKRVVTWAIA